MKGHVAEKHMNISLLSVTVCAIWIKKNSDLLGKFHCRCIKRQGYSTVNTARISASYLSYLHRAHFFESLPPKQEQPRISTFSHRRVRTTPFNIWEYTLTEMTTHDNAMYVKARTDDSIKTTHNSFVYFVKQLFLKCSDVSYAAVWGPLRGLTGWVSILMKDYKLKSDTQVVFQTTKIRCVKTFTLVFFFLWDFL